MQIRPREQKKKIEKREKGRRRRNPKIQFPHHETLVIVQDYR